ncbi:MAG: hypothetical protein ACK412_10625 [Chloroherpetonaceae bacterium]
MNGKISFVKIPELIEQALEEHTCSGELTIESLIEHDAETRQSVYEKVALAVSN